MTEHVLNPRATESWWWLRTSAQIRYEAFLSGFFEPVFRTFVSGAPVERNGGPVIGPRQIALRSAEAFARKTNAN